MEISAAIRRAVDERGPDKTVCPSEIARALHPEAWRELMDDVRAAAADMADRGELEVTQGGEVVDVRTARGPVRLGTVADRRRSR